MIFLLLMSSALYASDEQAVRKTVQSYVDARERRDPKAVEALFTADADQLVSDGTWRRGREAIVKGTLESSQRTTGKRTIDVESVRFLSAKVAIADGRYAAGTRQMWTSIWMVKQGRTWKISGIRNMLPAAQ